MSPETSGSRSQGWHKQTCSHPVTVKPEVSAVLDSLLSFIAPPAIGSYDYSLASLGAFSHSISMMFPLLLGQPTSLLPAKVPGSRFHPVEGLWGSYVGG